VCEDGRPRFPIRKFYYTLISVILFFLPVTVMTVAYVVIIYKLWVHRTPGESAALAVTRRTFSGQQTSASIDALAQIKMKKKVDSDLCSKTSNVERMNVGYCRLLSFLYLRFCLFVFVFLNKIYNK